MKQKFDFTNRFAICSAQDDTLIDYWVIIFEASPLIRAPCQTARKMDVRSILFVVFLKRDGGEIGRASYRERVSLCV